MAIWWQKWAAWFSQELQQPEKSDNTPESKRYEYAMRHPNVKLLQYAPSGKSRFVCAYHHEFVHDYDSIKNTHWGCPECNIEKKGLLTPHIPTAPESTTELSLVWYWQRREQAFENKDEMVKLCDELERVQHPLKILSYRVLPSDKVQGKWVYEFTIDCVLDGILRVQHPAFDSDNLPNVLCPRCQKRWSGELANQVKFPIKP